MLYYRAPPGKPPGGGPIPGGGPMPGGSIAPFGGKGGPPGGPIPGGGIIPGGNGGLAIDTEKVANSVCLRRSEYTYEVRTGALVGRQNPSEGHRNLEGDLSDCEDQSQIHQVEVRQWTHIQK
jgi:hypothetical protein